MGVELPVALLKRVLTQLIRSDAMKVENEYLIKKHIYYIDNVELIEILEKLLVTYYYEKIYGEEGCVGYDELFDRFTPQYINYDKLYKELEKQNNTLCSDNVNEKVDMTLNKYLL